MQSQVSKRIGFDLDGVLYPWQEVAYEERVFRFNEKQSYEDFWANFDKYSKNYIDFVLNDPTLVTRVIMSDKIKNLLRTLSVDNELFYVTARHKSLTCATLWWARTSKLPYLHNFFMVDGSKKQVVKDLKLDYYIEDREVHVLDLQELTQVIVMRQPWNKHLWNKFITIGSLEELISIIGEKEYAN